MSYSQILILIISTFAFCYLIYSVEIVNAEQLEGWACCEENLNGNSCTDRPLEECDTNFDISPNSCEETNFCEQGCCFSDETGLCYENSAKTNVPSWFLNPPKDAEKIYRRLKQ